VTPQRWQGKWHRERGAQGGEGYFIPEAFALAEGIERAELPC
jgi:hypothetical protein